MSALCPLSSALCPLSSVLCPLSSALCPLSSVLCPLSSVVCRAQRAAAAPLLQVATELSTSSADVCPLTCVLSSDLCPVHRDLTRRSQIRSVSSLSVKTNSAGKNYICVVENNKNANKSAQIERKKDKTRERKWCVEVEMCMGRGMIDYVVFVGLAFTGLNCSQSTGQQGGE
jgi:hypothetical protein